MFYRFSAIPEGKIKEWIEDRCNEVDAIVRNKLTMSSRDLEEEKRTIRGLEVVYKAFVKFRKKREDCDIRLIIDKSGYVDWRITLPLTYDEKISARERKKEKVEKLGGGSDAWVCVYMEEMMWEVVKDEVVKAFPMVDKEKLHYHIMLS